MIVFVGIGFKSRDYAAAVRVWGKPDYYTCWQDYRMDGDVDWQNDTIVYGRDVPMTYSQFTDDTSRRF